jgi:hypothetical protein
MMPLLRNKYWSGNLCGAPGLSPVSRKWAEECNTIATSSFPLWTLQVPGIQNTYTGMPKGTLLSHERKPGTHLASVGRCCFEEDRAERRYYASLNLGKALKLLR